MRLLVLGHSETEGARLPSPIDGVCQILERELPPRMGEPVEVVFRRLFANGPQAAAYVDRLLLELEPDYVLVHLASIGFAFEAIAIRFKSVLGTRGQRWCEALQRASERRAERLGGPALAGYMRLRRGLRKVVRPQPLYTPEATVEAYRAVFRRLAREEDAVITVIGGSHYHSRFQRIGPEFLARIVRVKAILRDAARDYRFAWVDHEALICAAGDPDAFYLPDGIHRTAPTHRLLADALMPVIVDGYAPARRALV